MMNVGRAMRKQSSWMHVTVTTSSGKVYEYLRDAPAIDDATRRWTRGAGLGVDGWVVCEGFTKPRTFEELTIHFRDSDGKGWTKHTTSVRKYTVEVLTEQQGTALLRQEEGAVA